MASRHIDPQSFAAMDWRDVGAMLRVMETDRDDPPTATLTTEQALAAREAFAAHAAAGATDG